MLVRYQSKTTAKFMTDKDKVIVAMTTCPSVEIADRIAQALVSERLAACVNQIPGVTSTYLWQDTVQTDAEVLLIIKTTEPGFDALSTRLPTLHPYELPEVIAIPVCAGVENYLDWIRDTVKRPTL
jgi:periplasmic divalent cation tolerance protein